MARFDRCVICDYFDQFGNNVRLRHIPQMTKEFLEKLKEEEDNVSAPMFALGIKVDDIMMCANCYAETMKARAEILEFGSTDISQATIDDGDIDEYHPLTEYKETFKESVEDLTTNEYHHKYESDTWD